MKDSISIQPSTKNWEFLRIGKLKLRTVLMKKVIKVCQFLIAVNKKMLFNTNFSSWKSSYFLNLVVYNKKLVDSIIKKISFQLICYIISCLNISIAFSTEMLPKFSSKVKTPTFWIFTFPKQTTKSYCLSRSRSRNPSFCILFKVV